MKISYTKYSAFLQNPERFRLYYMLGLTPEGGDTPTNMNLGKRRGSCFHSLMEARSKGESTEALVKQYGAELVKRCEDMAEVVPDLGTFLLCEKSFEIPILDGKHSITGRLDHVFMDGDNKRVGDFKTTKGNRSKKELAEYLAEMETSSQAHFYLHAAKELGQPTDLFTYHIVMDKKDKDSKPRYLPLDVPVTETGPAAVARVITGVYAACEAIEGLVERVGIEKSWPHSNHWPCRGDKFFCGYSSVCGRQMPKGCAPDGYTNRYKAEIEAEGI
jgi:hypothetical protein